MKRIFAILMVILLLGLYVWSFIAAITARPEATNMFFAAIFATLFFPILLYIYIHVGELLKGKGVDKENDKKKDEGNK